MTKHTPGPWEIVADDVDQQNNIRGYYIGHRESTAYAAEVPRLWGMSDDGEIEANAHLIAAAPEMLKALQGVLHHNAGLKDHAKISQALIRHVEQAIAKATGCTQAAPDTADGV